jgi:hypothetical protein
MVNLYTIEREGKKYAYRSTSRYCPDRKGPVAVNEYIGRVDETTGNIIPKKTRPESINIDKIKALRFGGSYALLGLAEVIGLRDDLFRAFGPDGERVLASSVAQILAGGPLSSVEDVIDGSMIRELMGISGRFTSPRMSEFTKRIGDSFDDLDTLFGKRLMRAGDVLGYDITSVSTHSDIKGWGEWGHNRDNESLKQMNVGLVTDKKGVPVMFETYSGSISDVRTLERTMERIYEYGASSCILVLDRAFGSVSNFEHMMDIGASFVIPGKRETKCVKALMSSLIKMKGDPEIIRIHDGAAYSVLEAEVAIVPKKVRDRTDDDESNDSADMELVMSDDERSHSVPPERRMRAFACFSEKGGADENTKMHLALAGIESKLRSMDPWTAARSQKNVAGGYSKYIECHVNDNGELTIERKRNSLSFAVNRSGMFVMFTSGVDRWEDMMPHYDCRRYVEQAFDVLKNELDGNRWRTSDPVTAQGRLLIRFVSLILWCTIASILRPGKKRIPVTSFVQSLDNIMAVGTDGSWRLTEITKKNRDYIGLLGVDMPPKKLRLTERDHRPGSVLRDLDLM